jgi:hypothetical protein
MTSRFSTKIAATALGPGWPGPVRLLVTLSRVGRRRPRTTRVRSSSLDKVQRQDGTVTFRAVEPGGVDESGQRVDCEVELSPQRHITRVYPTVGRSHPAAS